MLALHAMACVAGFMAGSTLPVAAAGYKGWWRKVHDHAGKLAIAFVCGATMFSLGTQAWALGVAVGESAARAPDVARALHARSLLPHAIPELCALFLPLAAWIVASRRGQWHQLLAATFFTTAIAVPVLIACAGMGGVGLPAPTTLSEVTPSFRRSRMAGVTEVTDTNFQAEVIEADQPVLVDFWAPWCGPCRMVAPIVEEIAGERPELKVVKLNTDENIQIASEYQIMAIPTLLLFRNGQVAKRIQGAMPKKRLEAEIEPALA